MGGGVTLSLDMACAITYMGYFSDNYVTTKENIKLVIYTRQFI